MKGKVNDLYTKFNNIYNELNSTSTSYMKGKINSIYSELLSSSSSSVSGQLQSIYDKIVSSGSGDGIKRVQWGRLGASTLHDLNFIIIHNSVNVSKSFLIINTYDHYGKDEGFFLISRSTSSFKIRFNSAGSGNHANTGITWQLVEFY